MHLHFIRNKMNNFLVTQIKIDDKKMNKDVLDLIDGQKLKFKYKYNKFQRNDSLNLLKYLYQQDKKWQLNDDTLIKMKTFFKDRFSVEKLKEKCINYGFDTN